MARRALATVHQLNSVPKIAFHPVGEYRQQQEYIFIIVIIMYFWQQEKIHKRKDKNSFFLWHNDMQLCRL